MTKSQLRTMVAVIGSSLIGLLAVVADVLQACLHVYRTGQNICSSNRSANVHCYRRGGGEILGTYLGGTG